MAPTTHSKRKRQQAELEEAFRVAVEQRDMERARELVELERVGVKCADEHGCAPLLLAFRNNDLGMARFLLDHGADMDGGVDTRDESSLRLLSAAVMSDSVVIAGLLLEYGADTECLCSGRTPLGLAIGNRNDNMVRLLLQYGAGTDGVAVVNTKAFDALSTACALQEFDIVARLLNHGVDVNFESEMVTPDYNIKVTPLCFACLQKNAQIAELLLRNGAKVLFPGEPPEYPSPLTQAISGGSLQLVRLILDNVISTHDQMASASERFSGPAVADYLGGFALVFAIIEKNLEAAQLLVDYGVNVNKKPILVSCTIKGNLEGARFLLGAGANVNQASASGETPLWTAAYKGHAKLVEEFLNAGADLNITNQHLEPETPLGVAYRMGHLDCVYLLLRASPHVWPRLKGSLRG